MSQHCLLQYLFLAIEDLLLCIEMRHIVITTMHRRLGTSRQALQLFARLLIGRMARMKGTIVEIGLLLTNLFRSRQFHDLLLKCFRLRLLRRQVTFVHGTWDIRFAIASQYPPLVLCHLIRLFDLNLLLNILNHGIHDNLASAIVSKRLYGNPDAPVCLFHEFFTKQLF